MGSTVREKHIRANRRTRSTKAESNHSTISTNTNGTGESSASLNTQKKCANAENYHRFLKALSENALAVPNPNPNPRSNSVFDDRGWKYCTEEQLEEILLKKLECMFDEAMNKLVTLGYDKEVALKAILQNGNCCCGAMDVSTNILNNSLAYLNSGGGGGSNGGDSKKCRPAFADLWQLAKFSLKVMVCLLQKAKPHLSKGEAMLLLKMSDLHAARAGMMEIQVLSSPSAIRNGTVTGCENASTISNGNSEGVISDGVGAGYTPTMFGFHSGWGFGNRETSEFSTNGMNGFLSNASGMTLQREIECPKRFNLTPSMKSLLKRNVAMFAAGFRANSKQLQSQSQPSFPCSLSDGEESLSGNGTTAEVPILHKEASQYAKNQDVVNSMMSKFQDLNLGENSADQKDEMIVSLVDQIKDLEKQVKERKEWAQQKAMQAATKLGNDLIELKMLRMEREETQRQLKKGKQTIEDSTMKRLFEMENALRKASGQVDRANAAVKKLETENEKIRAEMEASKLNVSESVTACLEVAKREKKCQKKLLAGEKQKTKMQDDIAAENQKISVLQKELDEVEANTKAAETKWRQEQKSKELLLTQLEEERRLKEASEANNKRKIEALKRKIDIDFQHTKDDLQRLEQEYARLKEESNSMVVASQGEIDDGLEDSLEKDASCDRACIICTKDEVSVVFLPCAHQVICANCNDNYGKKGKAACPYCRVPIEQRIRVYGASSS